MLAEPWGSGSVCSSQARPAMAQCPPCWGSKAPTLVSLLRSSKPTLQPTRTPRPGRDIARRAECRDLFMVTQANPLEWERCQEFLGSGEPFVTGPCPLHRSGAP